MSFPVHIIGNVYTKKIARKTKRKKNKTKYKERISDAFVNYTPSIDSTKACERYYILSARHSSPDIEFACACCSRPRWLTSCAGAAWRMASVVPVASHSRPMHGAGFGVKIWNNFSATPLDDGEEEGEEEEVGGAAEAEEEEEGREAAVEGGLDLDGAAVVELEFGGGAAVAGSGICSPALAAALAALSLASLVLAPAPFMAQIQMHRVWACRCAPGVGRVVVAVGVLLVPLMSDVSVPTVARNWPLGCHE